MLLTESYWYKEIIENLVASNSLVIIIGSSTKTFREITQPHIYTNIYQPLEKKNCHIINVDLKDEQGVDLSGDITNPTFLTELKKHNADLIICSNLLEHIVDRDIFINSISAILKKDGLLLISVPYNYPYHSDPIDTMYRPNLKNLEKDLKDFKLLEGSIISCGMLNGYWYKEHHPQIRKLLIFRDSLINLIKLKKNKLNLIKWLFVEISITCGLFKKT